MFSLEQLPEIVRLDVDVHMVALHPERAVTRSPLQNTVVGTGWRTLDARKALRKEPRVVKTVSSDSYFAGHTASLLFQRSISARHRKKMTPDPRSAVHTSSSVRRSWESFSAMQLFSPRNLLKFFEENS